MANLILKPSTGGVLKIQNDDGTVDALSVSTGGNLTAAGTLAVTGNTTLSGTANNLGTVTAGSIAGGAITSATTFPAGHVLQVKSTVTTDRNSSVDTTTSGTGADVGLNVTITPVSSTSDFFIMLSVGVLGSVTSNSNGFILSKGTSSISDATKLVGANGIDVANRNGVWVRSVKYTMDSNHTVGCSATYLDTVSGSGIRTYKAGLISQSTSGTVWINRPPSDDNTALIYGSYTSSSLTVMEIQGA